MLVLAAPDAGSVGLTLADASDVDEHAVLHIDPAGIDDVLGVAAVDVDVVGVDIEEVGLGDNGVAGGVVRGGSIVSVLCAVEVVAEPLQGVIGDLDVEIEVPGHNLAVPPPAEESAMSEPGLDALFVEGGQVGADEVTEDKSVFGVGNLVLEVADVVMTSCKTAAGLTEILWSLGLLLLLLLLVTGLEGMRLVVIGPHKEIVVGYGLGGGEGERGQGQEAKEEGVS